VKSDVGPGERRPQVSHEADSLRVNTTTTTKGRSGRWVWAGQSHRKESGMGVRERGRGGPTKPGSVPYLTVVPPQLSDLLNVGSQSTQRKPAFII
jgi:hypothetical protein